MLLINPSIPMNVILVRDSHTKLDLMPKKGRKYIFSLFLPAQINTVGQLQIPLGISSSNFITKLY